MQLAFRPTISNKARGLVIVIGLFLAISCASWPALGQPVANTPVKVLTYNIHHGLGEDGIINLPAQAEVIRSSGADIIGLQEVDQKTGRSFGLDEAKKLGQLLDMNYVFAPHFAFQGGHYGLALLSRFPVLDQAAYPLPTAPGYEAKSMLRAGLDVFGTIVDVYVVHFEVNNVQLRLAQAEAAAAIVAQDRRPTLLMGDINGGADSKTALPLRRVLIDSYAAARFLGPAVLMQGDPPQDRTYTGGGNTFPVENPIRRGDCIYNSWQWLPADGIPVRTIASSRSDHRAVLATLDLSGMATNTPTASTTAPIWASTSHATILLPPTAIAWVQQSGLDPDGVVNILKKWAAAAGLEAEVADSAAALPANDLVILPGGRFLSADDTQALQAHVAAGGALLAWGDAGVESSGAEGPLVQPALTSMLGVEYVGWAYGYPNRDAIVLNEQASALLIEVPKRTEFWQFAGPIIRVAQGTKALARWEAARGAGPSHPREINTAVVQNGRTIYVAAYPLHTADPDNPETEALVVGLMKYLATGNN